MPYTVSQVAELAGVSVRTLHHYDEIGLLHPTERSDAGYRRYTDADLERLQEVLFFRELGFRLADIGALMEEPGHDRKAALEMQRELLGRRARQLDAMVRAIDKALDTRAGGRAMTKEEMFEVFGAFDPAEHEDEVLERWGDTDAYAESARRTSAYTKADWQRIMAESNATTSGFIAAMDRGAAPSDADVQELVEEHRLHIDRYFYPCSREMQLNLGEMYVLDARFKKTYDDQRAGLAEFLRDAIRVSASG